jgi:hypothetical protein
LTGFDFSQSMEKDIEDVRDELDDRQIDFEEFQSFVDSRLTKISSWNSRASSTAERLDDGESSIDDAFDLVHIPPEKDKKVLRQGEAVKINKVLQDSQHLIGQLTVMLKVAVDTLEYAEEAVDIQKQQKFRREVLNMMKDNVGDIMESSAESAARKAFSDAGNISELEEKVEELETKVSNVEEGSSDKDVDVDIDEVVDEVREQLPDSTSIDLETVVVRSDIKTKTDIGKILKHSTDLTNKQVAGILDSSENTVGKW